MAQEALTLFEDAADLKFEAHALPHPNVYVSTWYLLIASEDAQRIWFTSHTGLDDAVVEYLLDKVKFSLRSCLSLAARKARDRSSMPLPDKVISDLYVRARRMIDAGNEYAVVSQICGSIYANSATIVLEEGIYDVSVDERMIDARYSAFELMRQSASTELALPMSALIWSWIRREEFRPDVLGEIAASIQVKSRRVVYEFDPVLGYELAQHVPQRALIIPQGWKFPWGGLHETVLLMNSLSLRVLYHVCAVHFGAVKYGLKGGAEHDLVLCQSEDDWVQDILKNSSLDLESIRTFVRYLTFGNGVTSPDQALQPFVPLGRGLLGVPGFALMSSNVDRNLLTLQARVDPRSFDKQSELFERDMTRSLEDAFRRRWDHVITGRTYALGSSREELDLVVCEPQTKTVLVLELRWILSPADPREVQSKKVACHEKVPQTMRKRNAARANLAQLLNSAFGIEPEDADRWRVEAAVVVEGFGGAPTTEPTIPIIPEWVLEEGVGRGPNLQGLVDWLLSTSWLPVDGRDYHFNHETRSMFDMQVRYAGVSPIRTGREFLQDATRMLKAAER